jgi:hypothetical protein
MADTPPPKRNKYFQTALLDPTSTISPPQAFTYRSTMPLLRSSTPTGSIKLIIGSSPPTQRVWYLPRSLLARCSTHLADLCSNPFRSEISLPQIDPHAFANFVDYTRSSIYTLNTQVRSFHRVRAGAEACILGEILGATEYADAAVRALHGAFEAVTQMRRRSMRICVVRPEDVGFVCGLDDGVGDGLKKLVCEATAGMWGHEEVYTLKNGQVEAWKDVFDKCAMFKEVMVLSLGTRDRDRATLLRPVDKYLSKAIKAEKEKGKRVVVRKEVVSDSENEAESASRSVVANQRRRILTPKMRFSGQKRKDARERRRVQRTEVEQGDADTEEDLNNGKVEVWRDGEGEKALGDDGMVVDAERSEDGE